MTQTFFSLILIAITQPLSFHYYNTQHFVFLYKDNLSHEWLDRSSKIFEEEYKFLSTKFVIKPLKIKKVIITNHTWEFTSTTQLPNHIAAIYKKDFYLQNPQFLFKRGILRKVIRHEMVHFFIEELTGDCKLPLWFNEGIAVYISSQNMVNMKGIKFVSFDRLNLKLKNRKNRNQVKKAYLQSHQILNFLIQEYDWKMVLRLLKECRKRQSFEKSFNAVYPIKLDEFEKKLKKKSFFN